MAKRKRADNLPIIANEKICAALIGLDLVALVQLIAIPNPNLALKSATLIFAVALPILAFPVANSVLNTPLGIPASGVLLGMGTTFTLSGIALVAYNSWKPAGIAFAILASLGVTVTFIRGIRAAP